MGEIFTSHSPIWISFIVYVKKESVNDLKLAIQFKMNNNGNQLLWNHRQSFGNFVHPIESYLIEL